MLNDASLPRNPPRTGPVTMPRSRSRFRTGFSTDPEFAAAQGQFRRGMSTMTVADRIESLPSRNVVDPVVDRQAKLSPYTDHLVRTDGGSAHAKHSVTLFQQAYRD